MNEMIDMYKNGYTIYEIKNKFASTFDINYFINLSSDIISEHKINLKSRILNLKEELPITCIHKKLCVSIPIINNIIKEGFI